MERDEKVVVSEVKGDEVGVVVEVVAVLAAVRFVVDGLRLLGEEEAWKQDGCSVDWDADKKPVNAECKSDDDTAVDALSDGNSGAGDDEPIEKPKCRHRSSPLRTKADSSLHTRVDGEHGCSRPFPYSNSAEAHAVYSASHESRHTPSSCPVPTIGWQAEQWSEATS